LSEAAGARQGHAAGNDAPSLSSGVSRTLQATTWGRGSVPILGCALDNGSLVGAAELAWQPVLDDPAILDA
jgi:hypothetical protein